MKCLRRIKPSSENGRECLFYYGDITDIFHILFGNDIEEAYVFVGNSYNNLQELWEIYINSYDFWISNTCFETTRTVYFKSYFGKWHRINLNGLTLNIVNVYNPGFDNWIYNEENE